MAKKILLFSPPFSGHLNVFRNLIWKYQDQFDFHLIIAGWKNIKPDLREFMIPVTILAHSNLKETDPAIWTLPRAVELTDDCLKVVQKERPDLIIYDFFSLEGNFVGKTLGIPYWSSIPALMGPFIHRGYLNTKLRSPINLAAINGLQQKLPGVLNTEQIEMISDGLYIAGQKNLIWSYPALTPNDFMLNRQPAKYIFVGHLDSLETTESPLAAAERPLVYFSFGTVVIDYLWEQGLETRDKLKSFLGRFAELSKNADYDILFVNRGKNILNRYPLNWRVVEYADQIAALSQASVFITHAGGNGFHEAVLKKVPMIAIPFFGDQPLIARQIEKLGLGKNLVPDNDDIDTKKSKDFLNESLADKVDFAITNIMRSLEDYKNNFSQLRLESEDIFELLSR